MEKQEGLEARENREAFAYLCMLFARMAADYDQVQTIKSKRIIQEIMDILQEVMAEFRHAQ